MDSKSPDIHSKLLTAAARQMLKPAGFQQKGRSRIWFKDNHWWAVLVEFQPSAWSKGSYLNVSAMWLWAATGAWSFHAGHRHGQFISFENPDQFAVAADGLARDALRHVTAIETQFASLEAVRTHLQVDVGANPWTSFHATMAALAVRDVTDAQQHLERLLASEDGPDWVDELKERTRLMVRLATELADPRDVVSAEIVRSREMLKLRTLSAPELWA